MQKESAIVTGAEVKKLFARCVYAWQRGDEWLYVGQSSQGIGRFSSHHVVRREHLLESDRLVFWYVETEVEALALEAELIWRHSPIHNQTLLVARRRVEKVDRLPSRDPKKYDSKGRMRRAEFQARVDHNHREYFRKHPSENPIIQYTAPPPPPPRRPLAAPPSSSSAALPSPRSPLKESRYFKAHKKRH